MPDTPIEEVCSICNDTNGEHKPGYRCYPRVARANDFMDTADLGFDSAGMIQYFRVREAALEAARLLQGDIPSDEREDPADHFWNLFEDAFPLIDPQNLPPRAAPLSPHA